MRQLRFLFFFLGALALFCLLPTGVEAGGWAVVTLDYFPVTMVVGEPVEVGFTVRQHGLRPLSTLSPSLEVVHRASGRRVTTGAEASGTPGHYVATLRLPEAGAWRWTIVNAFGAATPMPDLQVLAQAPASSSLPRGVWAALLLAGVVGGVWAHMRARPALALLLFVLVVGVAGVMVAGGRGQAPVALTGAATREDAAAYGAALFRAKGCVTCHSHDAVGAAGYVQVNIGPNLTHYAAEPDFLREWLQDPPALRPGTQMPNLELGEEEIEALIAFLQHDG